MRNLSIFLLVFLLAACGGQTSTTVTDVIDRTTKTADFACDVREAITPAQLSLADVEAAADTGCTWLRAFQEAGVIPSAPAPAQAQVCATLSKTGAARTEGYERICGDALVDVFRKALTAYETAMVGVFPGYRASNLIVFNQATTDSTVCGENSITAISMCGDEIYLRPSQLATYEDPYAAAVYAASHEVGHIAQRQTIQNGVSLLFDYAQHQAFRELQSDCIVGALSAELDATQPEIERGVDLLLSIGDLSTHGTKAQRRGYALYGFEKGYPACLSLTPSAPLILS